MDILDYVIFLFGLSFLVYSLFFSEYSIFHKKEIKKNLIEEYRNFLSYKEELKKLDFLSRYIKRDPEILKLHIYSAGIYEPDIIRIKFVFPEEGEELRTLGETHKGYMIYVFWLLFGILGGAVIFFLYRKLSYLRR